MTKTIRELQLLEAAIVEALSLLTKSMMLNSCAKLIMNWYHAIHLHILIIHHVFLFLQMPF